MDLHFNLSTLKMYAHLHLELLKISGLRIFFCTELACMPEIWRRERVAAVFNAPLVQLVSLRAIHLCAVPRTHLLGQQYCLCRGHPRLIKVDFF